MTDSQKATINEIPIKNIRFENITIRGLDWRGLDLGNLHFTNCTFKDMSFENLDISGTTFVDCKFDRSVRLDNALLCKGLQFNANKSSVDLIKQYAGYIKNEKSCRVKNDLKKAEEWRLKAEGLNKILGCLKLDLRDTQLKNLDLSKINLSNADFTLKDHGRSHLEDINLTGAYLEKIRLKSVAFRNVCLSDTLTISTSLGDDNLFRQWQQAQGEDKQILQKLFNAGLKIITSYIPNQELKKIVWQDIDMRGADLNHAKLQGINFSGVDLENTDLSSADLSNADLTGAKFKNTNLEAAILSEVFLSKTLRLPTRETFWDLWFTATGEDKKLLQNLLNSRVNILRLVPSHILKTVVWQEVDLSNSFWQDVNMTGLNLSKTNLQNAYFEINAITNVNFTDANLKKATIRVNKFNSVNFENTNLRKGLFLFYNDCELKDLNLKDAFLGHVKLSDRVSGHGGGGLNNMRRYRISDDAEAIAVLKQLLIAQGIDPDSEELPAKRRKTE